jgi:hypothetical protein
VSKAAVNKKAPLTPAAASRPPAKMTKAEPDNAGPKKSKAKKSLENSKA